MDSNFPGEYLVVHGRGTEGWSVEGLRKLVTRNSMIGVEQRAAGEAGEPMRGRTIRRPPGFRSGRPEPTRRGVFNDDWKGRVFAITGNGILGQ